MKATLRHVYLCRTANMSWRTCVVVKQIQSNQSNLPFATSWTSGYWVIKAHVFVSAGCQAIVALGEMKEWTSWQNTPLTETLTQWQEITMQIWSPYSKSYISPHPDLGFIDPLQSGLETHFCQWRSQRSSSGCGGTCAFPLRSTSVC